MFKIISLLSLTILIIHSQVASGQKSKHNTQKNQYKACIGTDQNGLQEEILKSHLLVQVGVSCNTINTVYYSPCTVSSYRLILISSGQIIFNEIQQSGIFSEDVKKQFVKLSQGDLVIVSEVMVKNAIEKRKVSSMVYKII